jgi:DNA-binding IclR family transcriptional regulator
VTNQSVIDRAGRPCAAVAVSAPVVRLAPDDIAGLAAEVKAAAGRIARMLGSPVTVSTGPRAA